MYVVVFLLLAQLATAQSFRLTSVDIKGLDRFKSSEVLATLKLSEGASATKAQLESACQTLVDTGLFDGCDYGYSHPAPGAAKLSLKLVEAPPTGKARLTFTGDEAKLWAWCTANEPLIRPDMPTGTEATNYYLGAMRRMYAAHGGTGDVTHSIVSDLGTGESTIVFRPKDLPEIVDVRFEGASAIAPEKLRELVLKPAKGTPFTEFDFRTLVDLNATPAYEKVGRLAVTYPAMSQEKTQGGVIAVARVNEGPVYKLSGIDLTGLDDAHAASRRAGFPFGDIANMEKITGALETLRTELRNRGHLAARYSTARKLNANDTVDISAAFEKGPVFTFARLIVRGLPGEVHDRVVSLWKLKPGEPMNEGYTGDFLREAYKLLGNAVSGASTGLTVPKGTFAAEVQVGFTLRQQPR